MTVISVNAMARAECAGMIPVGARLLALLAASLLVGPDVLFAGAQETVRFNRDIRPILSDNCYACHGPDGSKRKAKLRLDTRGGLFKRWEEGGIVIPGSPDRSFLWERVVSEDASEMMPPPETGKVVSAEQKDLLRRWITAGAVWEGHWSYQPVERPAVPEVESLGKEANPIDRFLRSRLEAEGMLPAESADRRTLIRRLSLDLTGLPPTPAEVHRFDEDLSSEAWETLVDRYLASPHYGERMALYWLDVVRYADTDGFHADNYRSVWPYRDYVIRSFNENKPFDRFTVEQLAGDLLPEATLESRVASTYNRLGRSTEEGGAQPKEYLAKYAAERVRSVGAVWLGSTTGCAECHDHKFDPYTAKDFYRLAAYFADIKEEGVGVRAGSPAATPEQAARLEELHGAIGQLEAELERVPPHWKAAYERWLTELQRRVRDEDAVWFGVTPTAAVSAGGSVLRPLVDGSLLSEGSNPEQDTYTILLPLGEYPVTALRLETLPHPDFPNGGLGRGNGNFILTDISVERLAGDGAVESVEIESATADFSQSGWPIEHAIDGDPATGWAVAGHENPAEHRAIFQFRRPVRADSKSKLAVKLRHNSVHARHNIGRFRLTLSSLDQPTLDPRGMPPAVVEALELEAAARSPEQSQLLERRFLAGAPELAEKRSALAELRQAKVEFVQNIPTTLMTESQTPRVTRVLPRGNWMDDSGEVVVPGPPEFLAGPAQTTSRQTRLDLALWLVSRDNPLTARVWVNRLWRLFFGVGLSKNVTDFGAQGEWPKHPELLDWLASEWMESGWDVKHLVRLMVTSAAYRQSSAAAPEVRQRDPFNRLVARQSRVRLDAEVIRDNALAASGLLMREIGGPSVKPYQPDGYWDHLNFPKRQWQAEEGERLYRRGLYVFWCRTFLHPSLLSFDACPREESTPERVNSNTPLQALTLLNDPIYVEASRVFAQRILREGGEDAEARLAWAFDQLLSRLPSVAEITLLKQLVLEESERYRDDPQAAQSLLAVGAKPAAADLKPAEVATWTAVARTLLNLDETVVRN